MLRPVDIAVALKLTLPGAAEKTYLELGHDLHLSASEVHSAYKRAQVSGLATHSANRSVNRSALLEFLKHGIRYAFPAVRGQITRGIPTAYAADPLRGKIQAHDEPPPVWPDASGKVRGYSLLPLYKRAAAAAAEDSKLYELLSLVDAVRDGSIRERGIAMKELESRIGHHAS